VESVAAGDGRPVLQSALLVRCAPRTAQEALVRVTLRKELTFEDATG
jgi:hypothetical protein